MYLSKGQISTTGPCVKLDVSRVIYRGFAMQQYKRLFAFLITSLTWSTHWSELDVIYEQRERVFHRDIQTRENNGENTSAQRECFCPLFSRVFGYPGETRARVFFFGFSNESRRNRMFSFVDLNRIPKEAYRN